MTKMEMFASLLTLASDNAELTNAIQHEIDLLTKRKENATPHTSPKTVENARLKGELVSILRMFARPMTIAEVMEQVVGEYADPVTHGRVSALLSILVRENLISRAVGAKKVITFAITPEGVQE